MSYFDLDPRAADDILNQARAQPGAQVTPGFFDDSLTALPKGIYSGLVAKPALLLGDVATPALTPIAKSVDEYFGGTSVQDFLLGEQKKNLAMVQNVMPDANTGTLGNLLYGAGDVLASAAPGAVVGGPLGAAASAGFIQGYAETRLAEERGIDTKTAIGMGAITGLSTAAGVVLPGAIPGNLLKSIGVGIASNVPLGMLQRGGTGQLLESRGYTKEAERYHAMDGEAILTDTILGAAFGVLGARARPHIDAAAKPDYQPATPMERGEIPPAVVDSALASESVEHVQTGTAPGIPADPMATANHVAAVNKAADDLIAGRDVDVSETGVADVDFIPARSGQEAAVHAALQDLHPLRQSLDELDQLRAEAKELGLELPDEPLFSGKALDQSNLPGMGRAAEVFVGDRPEPVRFQVVEADSLAPTIGKAENQYRDRTRVASELQITKIAGNLQFGRLGDAPTMTEGAPTIARDGRIVGGNGRVAAVRRAYEAGGAEGYREQLTSRAAEFGLDPADISGMKQPVLVRRFANDVNVREAAILSNEGGALEMSALEQAKVDAERMPNMAALELPESGDLNAASVRDFMRQWLANIPGEQHGRLVSSDGKMSPEGLLRARNALLYKAYGDSPTLARLIDSSDEAQKNVANALVKSAANVADAREAIEAGDLHDLDIQPQILQAVDKYAELRETGMTVDSFANQGDLYGNYIGPESVAMMRFMEANKRSAKAISEAISGYYDQVRALGNPKQANIFDAQPPSRAEILAHVLGKDSAPADLRGPVTVDEAKVKASAADVKNELRIDDNERGFEYVINDESVNNEGIVGAHKNEIGRIIGNRKSNRDGDSLRITTAVIGDKYKGKGRGVDAYSDLIDQASAKGMYVESDIELTQAAARVYEKLAERGYDVQRNPNARLEDVDGEMKLVSTSGPVFKVYAKPEAAAPLTKAQEEGASTKPLDPVAANQSEQILMEMPNATAVDDAGQLRTAGVLLGEAEMDLMKAEQDAPGYDAAVACALRV